MENPESEDSEHVLASAQLAKLNLEIEELKSKGVWQKRVALSIPILSVLIAVAGFLFGIYQFERQQRTNQLMQQTDQVVRVQNTIRSDLDQILRFPTEKQQTVAKVISLLEDLKGHVELSHRLSNSSFQNTDRGISLILVRSVMDDCDFDQHRDVNYASTLMEHWVDYKDYLRSDPAAVDFILALYEEALKNSYREDPATIRTVVFSKEEDSVDFPKGYGKLNTSQILHFQDLIVGFEKYIALLNDDTIKRRNLAKLEKSICNQEFAENYFRTKINPEDAPKEPDRCPKRRS